MQFVRPVVNDQTKDPVATSRAWAACETIGVIVSRRKPPGMSYIERVVLTADVNCSARTRQGWGAENVSCDAASVVVVLV